MLIKITGITGFIISLLSGLAFAGDTPTLNSGDTAWIIVATALVMMMTPAGLALFYGGMSRYKNLLNTYAMTFVAYCIGSLIWVGWGYSLTFSGEGAFIGNLDSLFLKGMTISSLSGTIPSFVFVVFQMTFACITLALVLGSVVDRMKFSAWLVFSVLWLTFVYTPVAHWVWGGGWMDKVLGALDFAGGNVVHINAGVAGLVLSLMLGKRKGYGKDVMFPSSIALTALGAALLWFGWFGFNAGSALAADGLSASAFLVTNTSAAAGAIAWMLIEWKFSGKPTVLGIASGVVAGLVAITPAAGFVGLFASIILGSVAGVIGYFSVSVLKKKAGYDDSLDAFGVHGVCGVWGALGTGLFADPAITGDIAGLFHGNPGQLWAQFLSVIATIAFSAIATFVVVLITKMLTSGLRVDADQEREGLDSAIHGERGFELI
ncbi:ammonium transporter [Desulfocicer niacini]